MDALVKIEELGDLRFRYCWWFESDERGKLVALRLLEDGEGVEKLTDRQGRQFSFAEHNASLVHLIGLGKQLNMKIVWLWAWIEAYIHSILTASFTRIDNQAAFVDSLLPSINIPPSFMTRNFVTSQENNSNQEMNNGRIRWTSPCS
jgi:hypothetical protein